MVSGKVANGLQIVVEEDPLAGEVIAGIECPAQFGSQGYR